MILSGKMATAGLFAAWVSVLPAAVENGGDGSAGVSVTWELVSNTYHEEPRAKARFRIRNDGALTLTGDNWRLFYNQRPARTPISTTGTHPAEVEWINGNWWRIDPHPGFELAPGEESTIAYEVAGWWIKEESDAPMGLYLVLYDEDGSETAIFGVDDYEVKPFVRPEQMMRHRNDPLPLPTAANRYRQNEAMREVESDALLPVIPTPIRFEAAGESVVMEVPFEILHQDGLEREARLLAVGLEEGTGEAFPVRPGDAPQSGSVLLRMSGFRVGGADREAYRMEILPDASVTITGNDAAGVFYGIQTFRRLLPLEVYEGAAGKVELDAITVEDAPRFGYRGLLVDVARNMQTKEAIMKTLDLMASYKLNVLHFYLTDDEGWRIEIRALPELTDVGGRRGHPTADNKVLPPAYGSGPFPFAEGTYGSGYYTREEFVRILKYATDRHITVIPSINLPAHARAAIYAMEARYERLIEDGDEEAAEEYRLIDPDDTSVYLSPQRYTDNVVNVARESVYRFYETVVDELEAMYAEAGAPFEFMHTGGDEVAEGAWRGSPMAERLLRDRPGIGDPQNLQAYFSRRSFEMLTERGLGIGGWEEVAQIKEETGTYVPNPDFAGGDVVTYVWRNQGRGRDLAYRLAFLHGGFQYRIPRPGAIVESGILKANIEYPGLEIRYTTDGTEPAIDSPEYTEPVEVSGEVMLRAFDRSGTSGPVVAVNGED